MTVFVTWLERGHGKKFLLLEDASGSLITKQDSKGCPFVTVVANWNGTAKMFPSVYQQPLRLWKQTMHIPLKSSIKLLPEMKKLFLKSSKFVGFKDLFWKSKFLENGHGRHQMGAIHYTFIFN